MNKNRQLISTGTTWETTVGYSRAVRVGNLIEVSGTTAVDAQGEVVGTGDYYQQTFFTLELIKRALEQAGAAIEDVIRTRMYTTDISAWEAIGKAHGEFFRDIMPATTLVEVRALIRPEILIEIEATGLIQDE